MFTFVLIVHVIVSLLLMAVILLQDGKGGDIVSTMGGGGSQTVFGSTGATSFLTKGTITLTVIFVLTSLSLAILKTKEKRSILDTVKPAMETSAPAPATTVTPDVKKETQDKPSTDENAVTPDEKKQETNADSVNSEEAKVDKTKESESSEKKDK